MSNRSIKTHGGPENRPEHYFTLLHSTSLYFTLLHSTSLYFTLLHINSSCF
jgi:hypothetical protein